MQKVCFGRWWTLSGCMKLLCIEFWAWKSSNSGDCFFFLLVITGRFLCLYWLPKLIGIVLYIAVLTWNCVIKVWNGFAIGLILLGEKYFNIRLYHTLVYTLLTSLMRNKLWNLWTKKNCCFFLKINLMVLCF